MLATSARHAGAGIHDRPGGRNGGAGRRSGAARRARTGREKQRRRTGGRGLGGVRAQGRRRRARFLAATPAVQEVGLRMLLPSTDPFFSLSLLCFVSPDIWSSKFRCFNFAGAAVRGAARPLTGTRRRASMAAPRSNAAAKLPSLSLHARPRLGITELFTARDYEDYLSLTAGAL